MSDISSLIEVFRMDEVPAKTRARIIIKLGTAINYSFSSNVTEPIVVELVKILDPDNPIFGQEHYQKFMEQTA